MNKKQLTIGAAVIAGLILFFATPIPDILFGLFFGGVIPGTNTTIPWSVMFLFYFIATIAVIMWTARKQLYPGSPKVSQAQANFKAKNAPVKKKKTAPKKKSAASASVRAKKRTRSYSRA